MRIIMGGIIAIIIVLLAVLSVDADDTYRRQVIKESAKYLCVRETQGPNRSPEIDRMHRTMGLPYGNPWCALYVYQCHEDAARKLKVKNPLPKSPRVSVVWKAARKNPYRYKTVSATRLARKIEQGLPADSVIWSSGKAVGNDNWNGHTGLLLKQRSPTLLYTREGNTTPGPGGNQRDGGGVYDRNRNLNIGKRFQVEGLIRVK